LSIGQLIACYLLDRLQLPKGKYLLLLVLAVLYFVVLPPRFFPQAPAGQAMCGLPAMAISLFFWVGGTIAMCTTLLVYRLVNTKRRSTYIIENNQPNEPHQ
jgi:hypothetical protein